MLLRKGSRKWFIVYRCCYLLGVALLIAMFDESVGRIGMTAVAVLLYVSTLLVFFEPALYVAKHWRDGDVASLISGAYTASGSSLFAGNSHELGPKAYYAVWLLISFMLLPGVFYKKWLNENFVAFVPLGFLAAFTVYVQVRTAFEVTVELIKKRKS